MRELLVDSERDAKRSTYHTGCYVRARLGDQWGAYDVATLTRDSLLVWVRHLPEEGREELILYLMGYL
jgi:hypothetical protein